MNFLEKISVYYLVIAFLIILYGIGFLSFGPMVLMQALPAVLAAVATDSLIKYFKFKSWHFSLSALITGLIIGLTAQFGASPLVIAFIAICAIVSKFFIRWEGKHIFNPAASGLLIGMLVLNSYPSWWAGGANPLIFAVWIIFLLIKQKRWAPMLGFILPVTIFSSLSILVSTSLLFFLSVMLIEPKTSPVAVKNGLVYGAIIGAGYLLISQTNLDPLIPSLLIGNLGARLMYKFLV